jgi:signal peptidase I
LKENEKYIVEKLSYRFSDPARGDFVILKSPSNPEVEFVKRVIGLPLEKIRLAGGQVYIDNLKLDESAYLQPNTRTDPQAFFKENQELAIPENHFFVMGDNRSASSDSRNFGPISKKDIIGKVTLRFWPISTAP